MPNVKDLLRKIESGDISYEEKLAALAQVEASLQELKAKKEERVKFNVQLIIDEIKKVKQDVQAQLDYARSIVPERGPKGDQGERGVDGAPGRNGVDGRDGRDGKDGQDGQDGVSVTGAKIDFDGSLIITLSTGREINVGEVVAADLAEKIRVTMSTNSTVAIQDEGSTITSGVRNINFTGSGVTATASGDSVTVNVSGGGVTSVTGTAPVVSSGGTTPAISLAAGYGDTQNPYASKTANFFLAAPNGSSGAPAFRAIVAADIPSTITISNKTSAYTVVAGDLATVINCTGSTSFTVSLTAAATLGAGFNVTIWNNTTTTAMAVTIDPNGAETIDGQATLILRRGEGMQIVCNGTNWQIGNKKVMRGYVENYPGTSNRPIATGNYSVAIGEHATSTTQATDTYALAIYGSATAARSTAIGQNSNLQLATTVTGSGAMALGGSYASGDDAFAAAVANNTSSYGARGTNSIAIGQTANASATNAVAIGKLASATATGALAIGPAGTATGYGALASGENSVAMGDGAISSVYGKFAYSQRGFGNAGDAQYGNFVLIAPTTDATATRLTTNRGASGTTSNQAILSNNSAYAFTGTVVARRQAAGGTASAAWKIEGLIRREGTAASTTLVASTVTTISNVPGWTLALSADTTNGGLAVTATGAAATNIRWVATIQTSEVTYA
jgi:hypothetical protein